MVGRIEALGAGVNSLAIGQRVGIPCLGHACGLCPGGRAARYLCAPLFTGWYARDGGFCLPLGEEGDDAAVAPLLCAGLIGWRSLKMAGEGKTLGLYGFGAAAHIIAQVARWQGRKVFAFTSPGDSAKQDFAQLAAEVGGRIG